MPGVGFFGGYGVAQDPHCSGLSHPGGLLGMASRAHGWVASRAGSWVFWLLGFGVSSSSPPMFLGTQPAYAMKAYFSCYYTSTSPVIIINVTGASTT